MTEPFTVTLNTIRVTEHVNYETGLIAYTVARTGLSGTVTVNPSYRYRTDTWPTQISLESSVSYPGDPESDPLTIDGEQIACRYSISIEEPWHDRDEDDIWEWYIGPDAHLRYAEDVMQALAYLQCR